MVIRFEFWETVITKNILPGTSWEQSAKGAAKQNSDHKDWTIVNVKQTSPDTLEILKRRNCKIGWFAS